MKVSLILCALAVLGSSRLFAESGGVHSAPGALDGAERRRIADKNSYSFPPDPPVPDSCNATYRCPNQPRDTLGTRLSGIGRSQCRASDRSVIDLMSTICGGDAPSDLRTQWGPNRGFYKFRCLMECRFEGNPPLTAEFNVMGAPDSPLEYLGSLGRNRFLDGICRISAEEQGLTGSTPPLRRGRPICEGPGFPPLRNQQLPSADPVEELARTARNAGASAENFYGDPMFLTYANAVSACARFGQRLPTPDELRQVLQRRSDLRQNFDHLHLWTNSRATDGGLFHARRHWALWLNTDPQQASLYARFDYGDDNQIFGICVGP